MKQTISIQKFILTVIILIICTSVVYAQPVKINNGDNEMSIGGIFSSYLNIRQRDPGHDNLDKNVFKLKDARLDIQGKVGDDYDYHLQVNLASISATTIDPESPALYDAYFTYKGWKAFDIRMGYSKVPYSYASLIESDQTPYWEHAEFAKGDLFSRRDIGIRLSRSFWNERIKAYAGMYTGVGEVILQNVDNDPSGAFEYIGRVEISYPEKCQYEDIDMNVSQTPNFSLGLNGRYSNRTLPAGKTFIPFEGGNYPDSIKVVNGEKYILGMDASVKYKGFMLQYEGHQMTGKPQSPNDPQLEGKGNLTNYFRAGGWLVQASYFCKPIKSVFAVRYDEMNENDLAPGIGKHLTVTYSYQVKGLNSMIKAEYFRNLQDESIDVNDWQNQYRLGWQFIID